MGISCELWRGWHHEKSLHWAEGPGCGKSRLEKELDASGGKGLEGAIETPTPGEFGIVYGICGSRVE
jgi:hypothetical protein